MLFKERNRALSGRLLDSFKYYRFTPLLLFLLLSLIPYVIANWDPYEILGVRRDANLDQIKRAYRDMARKLHPDKSNLDEDEASQRFIELNKAFSILKDPTKKSRFDLHGQVDDSQYHRGYQSNQRQNRQTREYRRQSGHFTFFSSSNGYFRRKSITSKQYYREFLEESKFKLFFIFFYADFCSSCTRIESTWNKITDELENYNIGSFTINVHHEPRLFQDLGLTSIPQIACLIDGQIKFYYQPELSLATLIKFTKNILPNNLIPPLRDEKEQDRFIALGSQQNRLSAIIINNEHNLKLRYLLIAFELRLHYRFGHVSIKTSSYSLLAKQYNLTIDPVAPQTRLMVFDEDTTKPIINIFSNSDNLDVATLRRKLSEWPFLQLPKLSSQPKFDDLCLYTIPRDGVKTSNKLCVILFTVDTPSSLQRRSKFIEFIQANRLARNDKVVFSFLDPSKQTEFVTSLLLETEETYPFKPEETIDAAILTIERNLYNTRKAVHKWIQAKWDIANLDELYKAKLELLQLVTNYKSNSLTLKDKVALPLLIDEEGPSLISRIFSRLINHTLKITYYVTSRESFNVIIVLTICALITSIFLYQHPPTSHDNFETFEDTTKQQFVPTDKAISDDMKIIELKAETYNGMIRLLKPGYRSIVLLTDQETKGILLPLFKGAVWPYRRNKTLLFGYLCLDKNLNWYQTLLQQVTGVSELNVNKKNCIGTVLSLNGFKKYFRVYHVKHSENKSFNDETDDDSYTSFDPEALYQEPKKFDILDTGYLLDGLPIWLDKMFDGMTKRYFLSDWPDEIN